VTAATNARLSSAPAGDLGLLHLHRLVSATGTLGSAQRVEAAGQLLGTRRNGTAWTTLILGSGPAATMLEVLNEDPVSVLDAVPDDEPDPVSVAVHFGAR